MVKKKNSMFSQLSVKKIFMLVIFAPTLLAALYNLLWASDVYVSETKFSVFVEGTPSAMTPIGFESIVGGTQNKDLMAVQAYITSMTMLDHLQESIDIQSIYRSKAADFFSRLDGDATNDEFLEYYQDMIVVKMDKEASIITVKTRAFTAEEAQKVANAIISQADKFINSSLEEVRNDTITFSEEELKKAEGEVEEFMSDINSFKKSNKDFDPSASSSGIFAVVQEMKGEKAALSVELNSKRSVLSSNHIEIRSLKSKISSLNKEIKKLENSLVGDRSILANLTTEYERLKIKKDFVAKRYEIALLNYQEAIQAANRKNKYIVLLSTPYIPDEAVEPLRLYNIFSVFIVCFGLASLCLLLLAGVREHVVT